MLSKLIIHTPGTTHPTHFPIAFTWANKKNRESPESQQQPGSNNKPTPLTRCCFKVKFRFSCFLGARVAGFEKKCFFLWCWSCFGSFGSELVNLQNCLFVCIRCFFLCHDIFLCLLARYMTSGQRSAGRFHWKALKRSVGFWWNMFLALQRTWAVFQPLYILCIYIIYIYISVVSHKCPLYMNIHKQKSKSNVHLFALMTTKNPEAQRLRSIYQSYFFWIPSRSLT